MRGEGQGTRGEKVIDQRVINLDELALEHGEKGERYRSDTVRLGPLLGARSLGYSYDVVPPGKRACPYHFHHAQEEMFVILEGTGTLRVAGELLPLRAGDVVFIPPGPEYPHHILNTSDAPLKYLSISTRESPEICEYPDSGKYLAYAKGGAFDGLQRAENNLDYWDGEI